MLKIGEFAKIFNVTIKTIRFYEEKELLNPCYIDKYSGYRYYDDENIKQMNQILYLKKLGFSLDEIKKYDEKLVKKYQTEEQKDPIILDKENINANVIEDSIYEVENGSIRHDSLKTAYLIFSYLMKDSEK